MIGKSLAALAIVRAFGYPLHTSLTISASLAQIGEFSFILAALGVSLGLLPTAGQSLIVAGALLSITLNALVFKLIAPLEGWVRARPRLARLLEPSARPVSALPAEPRRRAARGHAVSSAMGAWAAASRKRSRSEDPVRRHRAGSRHRPCTARAGSSVLYGDAARQAARGRRTAQARLLVVTAPEPFQARAIIDRPAASTPRSTSPSAHTARPSVRTSRKQGRDGRDGRAGAGRRDGALRARALRHVIRSAVIATAGCGGWNRTTNLPVNSRTLYQFNYPTTLRS